MVDFPLGVGDGGFNGNQVLHGLGFGQQGLQALHLELLCDQAAGGVIIALGHVFRRFIEGHQAPHALEGSDGLVKPGGGNPQGQVCRAQAAPAVLQTGALDAPAQAGYLGQDGIIIRVKLPGGQLHPGGADDFLLLVPTVAVHAHLISFSHDIFGVGRCRGGFQDGPVPAGAFFLFSRAAVAGRKRGSIRLAALPACQPGPAYQHQQRRGERKEFC